MQTRFLQALALIAIAHATTAATCGGTPIPEPDSCTQAQSTAGITSIELGTQEEDEFIPINDGTEVELVVGGQGSSMLPVRYRLRGSSLPECIEQKSRLRSGESELFLDIPYKLTTYEEDDGSRTTKPFFMILDQNPAPGARGELHVEIGSQTIDRTVKFKAGQYRYPLFPKFNPTAINIAPGGTAILSLETEWVPFDPISMLNNFDGLSAPAKLDGGRTTFRVRAASTLTPGQAGELRVDDENGPARAEINIVAAREPADLELIIREALGPSLRNFNNLSVEEGDASCDGVVDSLSDQFIEVANRSQDPLQLDGVELIGSPVNGDEPVVLYTFGTQVLGAGEAVVLFSGALGSPAQNPAARCATFTGGHAGDATAVGGVGFDLRSYGDLKVGTRNKNSISGVYTPQNLSIDHSMEIASEEELQSYASSYPLSDSNALRFTAGLNNRGRPFALFNP